MMRISINEHIDGDHTVAGDPLASARAAGARAWSATDTQLGRLRSRLDQPRRVLVRDFLIFEIKQVLDSMKGLIIAHIAVAAFLIDMVRPRGMHTKVFYRVMDVGERMDHWLSLYGASRHAADDPEGLFGESREGSPTMLGQLERIVHRVVVGEDAQGELYTRSRATDPGAATPGPAGGAGSASSGAAAGAASTASAAAGAASTSGRTPAAGPAERPQAPGQAQAFTGADPRATQPPPADAGAAPVPGATPAPRTDADPVAASAAGAVSPRRGSSFEAENYGRRGDV